MPRAEYAGKDEGDHGRGNRHELEERDITTPAGIGEALGVSLAEAAKLLNGHRWREGDVEQLEAAAARLGLQVPMPDPWRP